MELLHDLTNRGGAHGVWGKLSVLTGSLHGIVLSPTWGGHTTVAGLDVEALLLAFSDIPNVCAEPKTQRWQSVCHQREGRSLLAEGLRDSHKAWTVPPVHPAGEEGPRGHQK